MRLLLGVAALLLLAVAQPQDYIERWRALTPGNLLERVTWGGPAVDSSDNVLVTGTVFPDQNLLNPRQFIAAKFTAEGDEVWSTRGESADNLFSRDLNVDGVGNLYMLTGVFDSDTIKVKSLSGANGAPRWERTFSMTPGFDTRNGADLAVKAVGNSTFIYVAVSEPNGTIRLTRLNPTTGESLFTAIVNGSLNPRMRQRIALDANGNVYMILKNVDVFVTKRSQSLAIVWNRVLAGTIDAGINLHPTTGEVAGMTAADPFSGGITLEVLDPVNGTPRRRVDNLPRVSEGFGVVSVFGHPSGGWIYSSADAFGERIQRVLTPTLNEQFARNFQFGELFVDSSGLGHGSQFDRAPVMTSWPRFGTFDLGLADSRGVGVAFDSQDRLIVSSASNGKGVLIQLEQKFLAGTDTFAVPFTGDLDVEAPGVLANDTLSRGGVLSVVTNPTKGTVTLNQNGGFHYTPGGTFVGSDQFQYQLTKAGVSRTATCFIKRLRIASLTVTPSPLFGGERSAVVKVTLTTGAFNLPFDLIVSGNPATVLNNLPRTLTFRPGDVSLDTVLSTPETTTNQNVTISATLGGETKSTVLTILPGAFNTIEVANGAPAYEGLSAKLRLKLNAPPQAARTFPLQYSGDVILSGPAEVTVAAGQVFTDFTVAVPDGAKNKRADILVDVGLSPGVTRLVRLTIVARPHLASAGPTTSPIYAGFQHRYGVTLDLTAGSLAVPVTNSSNDASVSVPTVNVSPGQSSGSSAFTPTLDAANHTVTITSRLLADTVTSTFLVRPNLLENFTVSPAVIGPFGTTTGQVAFNWVATGDGIPVKISTSTPAFVTVPGEVVMQPGRTVLTFPIAARGRSGTAKVTVKVGLKTITRGITITL